VNDHISFTGGPFGGFRQSGLGREFGKVCLPFIPLPFSRVWYRRISMPTLRFKSSSLRSPRLKINTFSTKLSKLNMQFFGIIHFISRRIGFSLCIGIFSYHFMIKIMVRIIELQSVLSEVPFQKKKNHLIFQITHKSKSTGQPFLFHCQQTF